MSKKVSASEQRRLVDQLQAFTQATPVDAARLLKTAKWNLNVAVELFFDDDVAQEAAAARAGTEGRGVRDAREKKLRAIFDEFKDPDGDAITIEEVAAFFEEVGITDMDSDVAVYLVSFELGSPSMGRLERKAFVDGWAKAKVDSIEGMKKEVPKWRKRFVSEPEYFRQVYKYVYDLGRQDGAKVIDRATALAFWQTLLPPVFEAEPSALASATPNGAPAMRLREFGWWCEFLESKGVKGVSKDVWNLFIEYAVKIPSTYDTYDEEDSWPSILDEFTEYAGARRKKEGDSMDLS